MAEIKGPALPESVSVLTPDALAFIESLQREFSNERKKLLQARLDRRPDFLRETENIRKSDWKVASYPADLQDRRVEITGPAEPKMMINALNSGAKVFMADMEDALAPTWERVIQGQKAVQDAVRRKLVFETPEKKYQLNEKIATLMIRPRGWHLLEKNVFVDDEPMSGSLFDFGLCFFHNANEQLARGTGPYFYLPKMESHLEARLWNKVFEYSQKKLGIPNGSIKVTVLIETLTAAFEMDEILYELKDHIVALNAGRWDYIFSAIKKMRFDPQFNLPDRSQITMAVPFMSSYAELLVQTCHKRGAHAMGGMAAFVPSRKDEEVNRVAFEKVREDKIREAKLGFDGTWVAHPDLVKVAEEKFNEVMGGKPNQKEKIPATTITAKDLLNFEIAGAKITEAGIRNNINVALQYIEKWLCGTGAVAIHNLMEDAATAEISRAQLWLWLNRNSMSLEQYKKISSEEFEKVTNAGTPRMKQAKELLDRLVLGKTYDEFLTLSAYEQI